MAKRKAKKKGIEPIEPFAPVEAINEPALIEGNVMAKSEPKKEPEQIPNPNIVVPKTRRVLDLL